jgi:hypothetical protein
VFEVPALTAEVTEYVRERGICTGCGHRHHATLPSGVPRGQLGPRALALVGTLAGQFHLSQAKVRDLLGQVMGCASVSGRSRRLMVTWRRPWPHRCGSCIPRLRVRRYATRTKPRTRATRPGCGCGPKSRRGAPLSGLIRHAGNSLPRRFWAKRPKA